MKQNSMLKIIIVPIISLSFVINEDISKYCNEVPRETITAIEKEKKLGKGGFAKVYQENENTAVKIQAIEKPTEKDLKSIIRELFFLKTISEKRKTTIALEENTEYNIFNSFPKYFGCVYFKRLDRKKNLKKIIVAIKTERFRFSLEDYTKKVGTLGIPYILILTKRIALALSLMHSFGYAHLDLKPQNIMMRNIYEPVLIDFGLTEQVIRSEGKIDLTRYENAFIKTFSSLGTQEYVSPEIIKDQENGFKADVYALGVMILQFFQHVIDFKDVYNGSRYGTSLEELIYSKEGSTKTSEKSWPFLVETKNGKMMLNLIKFCVVEDRDSRADMKTVVHEIRMTEIKFDRYCSENQRDVDFCAAYTNPEKYWKKVESSLRVFSNRSLLIR